jgi:hypothetical protein
MKVLSIALALVFLVFAVLAFVHPLPASGLWLTLGWGNDKAHYHHAIVYIVLALLCLVWYRFQSASPAR